MAQVKRGRKASPRRQHDLTTYVADVKNISACTTGCTLARSTHYYRLYPPCSLAPRGAGWTWRADLVDEQGPEISVDYDANMWEWVELVGTCRDTPVALTW